MDKESSDDHKTKIQNSPRTDALISDKKLIEIQKEKSEDAPQYGETSERWYNLVSYCFCLFANGFQWLTFSSFSNEFSVYYEISSWRIRMFAMIYFIVYPFAFIEEGWLLENFSLKIGLSLSSASTLLGSFFKIFINNDKTLTVCYVGQVFAALFRPLLLNSPGKIASNWFREDKRTFITSICCLSDTAGILVGYLWNLGYVRDYTTKNDYRDGVFRCMLSQFILFIILCLPSFFIDKDKPDIPSSPSRNKIKSELLNDLKLLCSNKRFIFLLISSFFIVGYYFILFNIFNDLLYMYKISTSQCTIVYSVSITVGIISSLIISFILDKFKKFRKFMIVLCALGLLFQVCLTFFLELADSNGLNKFAISLVFYILLNAVIIPFYTIGMNYACEISYPANESINGGIIMLFSQLCGIGGTYLFDYLINHNQNKKWIINVILIFFFVISLIFSFFFDEQLKRYEIDKNMEKKEEIHLRIESERKPVYIEVKQK